jgi:hypothetical protein
MDGAPKKSPHATLAMGRGSVVFFCWCSIFSLSPALFSSCLMRMYPLIFPALQAILIERGSNRNTHLHIRQARGPMMLGCTAVEGGTSAYTELSPIERVTVFRRRYSFRSDSAPFTC